MLELSDVSIGFRSYSGWFRQQEVTRLSGLDLSISAGEVVAVTGASGAGKSLLAHAILGLLPPNAVLRGGMRFDGHDLTAPYPAHLRGRHIALMPQEIGHLDPLATAGRQIRWAVRRTGGTGSACDRIAALGLPAEVGDLYPNQLSGGMARRVLMAIACAGAPDLLIADEPTTGLDPENRDTVLRKLRTHADAGRSVLLITHDLAAALPHADRVVILDDGRMCAVESAAAFRAEGVTLFSDHARALWQALPENGFRADA